jgi:hypothetical protein
MARTAFWGFESNDTATSSTYGYIELKQGTGCSFDTSIVRTGTYSGKVALTSGATGFFSLLTPPGYARFYVRITGRPATTARILFGSSAGANINLRLNPNGTIAFYTGSTLVGTSTAALTDISRWYMIEVRQTNGSSVTVLQIDGVAEVTGSPSAWGLSGACGSTDTVADTYTAYFDDVSLDGAAFPGPGKVVLLKPTADSAGGTGWRLGTNSALGGNGFGSVDNTPPVGVADLAAGSDPKQIRNATANANDSFDATMTTYTAAGIASGDTINAVDPFVLTAAPVSTSAKAGTVGVVSNPAIANIALSADGVSGAFWQGNAGGTYNTGWKLSHGTLTLAPSVTLGTAPVMRITQVTSSTRIAMVCFMGMYVDYTPAVAAAQIPYVNPMPPLIAQ